MAAVAHTSESKSTTSASRAVAHSVQARLQVGPTNDSYEQEADRVAARVVGSGSTQAASAGGDGSPSTGGISSPGTPVISRLVRRQAEKEPQAKLQRQEEEPQAKLQRQEEESQAKVQRQEEEPQAKVQRQEDEPQMKVQRQEEEPQMKLQRQEEEPQAKLQRQEEEPQAKLQRQEEEPQAKLQRQEEEPQAKLQRQEEEPQAKVQRQEEEEAQTKAEPRANVRDKRLYPVLGRVEDKLFDTKGKGEPMDDDVRVDMEGRFGADFSQVRIHKDGDASHLSKELKAQAFAHGADVFFNDGKYEPDSTRGKILLAHELTHVVQQGAAQQVPEQTVKQNNAQKDTPGPDPADVKAKDAEQKTEEIEQQGPPEVAAGEGTGPEGVAAAAPDTEGKQPADAPLPEGKDAEKGKAKKGEEKGEKAAKKGKAKGKGKGKGKRGKGKEGKSVGAFLRETTKATFEGKKAAATQLAQNQKQKDDPETKLKQTEKAVEPPTDEAQSRANASQVETVDQVKEPEPDEAKAKEELEAALDKAVPSSLEEVDKFKEEGKGRVVGQAVKGAVVTDTQEVQATYQKIEETPAPEQPPPSEALPDIETPPETPPLDMGDGVVGTVQKDHTDLSNFENEAESMLEEQVIPVKELEKVDEGDLAEAMQERKKVKEQVKEGPKEVKKLEQEEKQKVDQDLKKEEKEGRKKMQEERQKGLEGAKGDQQNTKKTIEQKRKEVTDHINGIYEKANTTVKEKLDALEKQALAEFDKGQAKATQTFEDNVNSRINAFKRRRYDRIGGSILWAKDKLLGMDDLPEVERIFDTEKSAFVRSIDQLIKQITKENQRVIQECKDIVADAKKEIEEYVAGLGPELQKTGQEALTAMKTKLDALDKQINDKEQELQKKLAEKREAAIQAIEEKIESMKEEMSGLVGKIGNLLLEAALKFFKWALKKAGFDATQLMNIINKGKSVISAIVDDPVGFIMNLVNAVKGGIDNFVKNIKKHLIGGLISWLTGAMADVPIQLPDTWDLKGILSLILQVLGLTYDRIRAKLVKRLGERVVAIAETSVEIVKTLITEGPIGLWEMIKTKADEIKQQVMDGIRNWVITELVKQAVIKLVSFLNPAGAIVQAIIAIYNTVMFFVENWQRIVDFVDGVFNSIGNIAKGQIGAASQKVEDVMAMTLPIIFNFLARLIGLGNIGQKITGIIKKVRQPIDKVVNAVIDKIVGFAKKLVSKTKKGAKALAKSGKEKLFAWWRERTSFKEKSGKKHSVFYRKKGSKYELTVASNPQNAIAYLNALKLPADKNRKRKKAIDLARTIDGSKEADRSVRSKMKKLAKLMQELHALDPNAPDGTRSKPYHLLWHKPYAHEYPNIMAQVQSDDPGKTSLSIKQKTTLMLDQSPETTQKDIERMERIEKRAEQRIDYITELETQQSDQQAIQIYQQGEVINATAAHAQAIIDNAKARAVTPPSGITARLNAIKKALPKLYGQKRRKAVKSDPVALKNVTDAIDALREERDKLKARRSDLKDLESQVTKARRQIDREIDREKKAGKAITKLQEALDAYRPVRAQIEATYTQTRDDFVEIRKIFAASKGSGKVPFVVGVSPKYFVREGSILGPGVKTGGRRITSITSMYKEKLKQAGYSHRKEGADPDHVTELSLSGGDKFDNLWPLKVNPSPTQNINVTKGKHIKIAPPEAGDEVKDIRVLKGKFFIIKGKYKPS